MTSRTAEHRKHIPLGVKLQACLLLLGFTEDEITADGQIEWDHHPALALRVVDEATGQLRPAPNDPRYIRPLRKAAHDVKTFGLGGTKRIRTSGSDIHAIAQAPRLRKVHDAFRAQQEVGGGVDVKVTMPTAPKRRSRPMPAGRGSRLKKKMNGKVVERDGARS